MTECREIINTLQIKKVCYNGETMLHTCNYCGVEFTHKWTGRKYCSRPCSGKANRPMGSSPLNPEKLKKSKEHLLAMRRKDQANRRARIKNSTPPDADMQKIKEIYLNCPEGYEVDHIIPLSKGGLHHQDNLQYLTANENRRKGNRI